MNKVKQCAEEVISFMIEGSYIGISLIVIFLILIFFYAMSLDKSVKYKDWWIVQNGYRDYMIRGVNCDVEIFPNKTAHFSEKQIAFEFIDSVVFNQIPDTCQYHK